MRRFARVAAAGVLLPQATVAVAPYLAHVVPQLRFARLRRQPPRSEQALCLGVPSVTLVPGAGASALSAHPPVEPAPVAEWRCKDVGPWLLEAFRTLWESLSGDGKARHVAAVRAADAAAFRADYTAVVSQDRVRVADVLLSPHDFKHPVFHDCIGSMRGLMELPLGDRSTAALSMPARQATNVQQDLLENEARIRRGAVEALERTFGGHSEGMVDAFPALHYLGLKALSVPERLKHDFTPAHRQRLVHYGEGVLRCLTTEVQPSLDALKPCFKHGLTCDLRFVTGLQRAYTPSYLRSVADLEARLERGKFWKKENDPLFAVISLPCMGKSLLLQDLARSLDAKGKHVACITYTGGTVISSEDTESVDGAITEFFVRLLVACAFPAHLGGAVENDLVKHLREGGFTVVAFKDVLSSLGLPVPGVVLVDEFTKLLDEFSHDDQEAIIKGIAPLSATSKLVISGFTTAVSPRLVNASGRMVVMNFLELPPVSAECLEDFRVRLAPHRALMMKESPLLYLSCQCSPGLLGHLFQLMTGECLHLPPLYERLQDAARSEQGEQLVEWLRDLTTNELCGEERPPWDYVEAQRQCVALVVGTKTTVAHPFAFVVILEAARCVRVRRPAEASVVDPTLNRQHQRALLLGLVRELSPLVRAMHQVHEELTAERHDALEHQLCGIQCEHLGIAAFHARALCVLAEYEGRAPVEIDPAGELHLPAPSVDGSGTSRGDAATTQADRDALLARIDAMGQRLEGLQERRIEAFVWKLGSKGAAASIVEGRFMGGRWSITLTHAIVGGALDLAQELATFLKSISGAPAPFGHDARISAVDVVLLCPGVEPNLDMGGAMIEEITAAAKDRWKCLLRVHVLTDSVGVRQHLSTPIAVLLPSIHLSGTMTPWASATRRDQCQT